MKLKYDFDINGRDIAAEVSRLLNQVFKLLPLREEEADWQKPLSNIMEELSGMQRLIENQQDLFMLISKLEGLFELTKKEDFGLFRSTIFECLGILSKIKQEVAK